MSRPEEPGHGYWESGDYDHVPLSRLEDSFGPGTSWEESGGWAPSSSLVIDGFSGAYRFLSNFWEAPVPYAGITYPSAEHAYQAAKVTDPSARSRIAALSSPGLAKRAGKTLVLRPGWDGMRAKVMLMVVTAKFVSSPDLASRLAATGDARLVEGNAWHDNFWGDCHCGKRSACASPGRNVLGRLLEGVRTACSEQ